MRASRLTPLGLLLAAVAAGPTSAPTSGPTSAPTTAPADAGVATLIRQLDADDWQARDAAAEQLVARGNGVRPAVADAAAHAGSAEVRSRAAGVIAKLDQVAADRPTRVTLHLVDVAPKDVFAELGRQAGIRFQLVPPTFWGQRGGKVSIDVVDQPFWAAVDDVCAKCGGQLQSFGQGGDLTVYPGGGDPLLTGPQSTQGRLTVVARAYVRSRQVSYADGAQQATDTLTILALLDPKLRVVDGTVPTMVVTTATDDKGTALERPPTAAAGAPVMRAGGMVRMNRARMIAGGPGMVVGRSFGGGPLRDLTISLKSPAAAATKIAVLKGTLTATVIGQQDTLRIDDAAHAGHAVRTAGPYTLELNRCDVTDHGISYDLSIRTGDGSASGTSPQVRLEDADGQQLEGPGSRTLSSENGGYHITADLMTTGPVKGPVRLVWDVATRTRSVTLPFELHDLPLPSP